MHPMVTRCGAGLLQWACRLAINLCFCYLSCTFFPLQALQLLAVCVPPRESAWHTALHLVQAAGIHITGPCTFEMWPFQQLGRPVTQGPREDTGFKSDANPGIAMVERIYNLCHQAYPKTKVMVSGIRKPEGARP